MNHYDVAIVGAGPAGMAVAKTLDSRLKFILIDKGLGVKERTSITSGFGGAGLFSDGKLVMSVVVGGNIKEHTKTPYRYLEKACQMFGVQGAPYTKVYLDDKKQALVDKAVKVGLELIPTNTIHLGTDGCRKVTEKLYEELNQKCKILLDNKVTNILYPTEDDEFYLEVNKFPIYCKYLVLAPGREGTKWLGETLGNMNIKVGGNKVDLGIRMEVPNVVAKELVEFAYDFKAHYYTEAFDDLVRTFCTCPRGQVVREEVDDLITCNGHSFSNGKTGYTNFALLVSIPFGDPISPNEFGRSIVSLSNNIAKGGVIVQRLGDLLTGRRSTKSRIAKSVVKPTLDAFPGDLSLVLPYRYLSDIIEMIKKLDSIAPGMMANGNLLYGVEAKFYSNVIELKNMETSVPNLFCVGDSSGVSRGIIQAIASGIIAGETINKKANAK